MPENIETPENRPTVADVLNPNKGRSADDRGREYINRRREFLAALQQELGIVEKYALVYGQEGLLPGINVNDAWASDSQPEVAETGDPVTPDTAVPADDHTETNASEPEATPSAESGSNG